MDITAGQHDMFLELLQQMAYASSEKKYLEVYSQFVDAAPAPVMNSQWHPIREQWVVGMVVGMKHSCVDFL